MVHFVIVCLDVQIDKGEIGVNGENFGTVYDTHVYGGHRTVHVRWEVFM